MVSYVASSQNKPTNVCLLASKMDGYLLSYNRATLDKSVAKKKLDSNYKCLVWRRKLVEKTSVDFF